MNVNYRLLAETLFLESTHFKGEYWIQDGYVQSANADIDDAGHESIVIEYAASQVLSELGIDTLGDHISIDEHDEAIFEAMQDNLTKEQMERYRDGEHVKVLIEYGKTVLNNPKFENLVLAAFDKIDVRRYAMKEWGWKAIRGSVVDTWTLTPLDLKKIDSGLSDAYDSEISEYENINKSVDENGFAGPYFDIEVYSRGDYYSEVPLSLIEKRDISKLMSYRTISQGQRISENGEKVGFVKLRDKPMSEKDSTLQSKLDILNDKYKDNLKIHVTAHKDYIELNELISKKTAPLGTGSSYMQELCKLADENNKIIVLMTALKGYGKTNKSDDYFSQFKTTTSSDRLKRFYGRFGFVSNYDKRDYRPDLRGNMHRYPKTK